MILRARVSVNRADYFCRSEPDIVTTNNIIFKKRNYNHVVKAFSRDYDINFRWNTSLEIEETLAYKVSRRNNNGLTI